MTKFRLTGNPPPMIGGRVPAPLPEKIEPVRNPRSHLASGPVAVLECGHKLYEPYQMHGSLYWCEECQHNRAKAAKARKSKIVPGSDELPF